MKTAEFIQKGKVGMVSSPGNRMNLGTGAAFLFAMLSLGSLGCEPPPPYQVEEPAQVVKDRDIPLPGQPDMHEYRRLITVTDPGVPDGEIDAWTRFAGVSNKLPISPRPELLDEIRNTAEVFNGLPYELNDELKQALMDSKKLKWLRLGAQSRGEDFKWIGKMKQLRGLSFVGSSLNDADFQDLAGLTELRYLGLNESYLPPSIEYPDFPHLEFLAVDGKFVNNSHFPKKGQFPKLGVFTATWSEITDEKLIELIGEWPDLRYVFLARCEQITEASAPELGKLKKLRYLQVGFTALSKELYDPLYQTAPDLQLQLPNCHIGFGK